MIPHLVCLTAGIKVWLAQLEYLLVRTVFDQVCGASLLAFKVAKKAVAGMWKARERGQR